MKHNETTTRRTLLGSIVTGAIGAVSGCLGSPDGEDIFADVFVDGTELVVDLEKPAVDQVDLLTPSGRQFADQSLSGDTDQVTIEIGTEYEPGEYEVVAIEDGDELGRKPVTIEPDVQITELRLGRNHPDEMFDGASDIDVRTETIITLENTGTGPERITEIRFSGDVPRPTPDNTEKSGIYNQDDEFEKHADFINITPASEIDIHSQLMPFSASGQNINCQPETKHGEFEITVETTVSEDQTIATYTVAYSGENLEECEIEVDSAS